MASQYCFIISDSCGTISNSCGLISNSCGIISCSCGMISLGCGRVYFFGEGGFWLGKVKKNLQSRETLESGGNTYLFKVIFLSIHNYFRQNLNRKICYYFYYKLRLNSYHFLLQKLSNFVLTI